VTEAIDNPDYWRTRLLLAQRTGHLHHAVFRCGKERWEEIARRHKEILARTIKGHDSVLDCGCGWGRLLELMPETWQGLYLGIDLSPDFVSLGVENNPGKWFQVGDLKEASKLTTGPPPRPFPDVFDWAVMISVRPMIVRNQGQDAWDAMEREIRKVARQLLYLEYDPFDNGSVE
jgi:hypothetical protein